MEGKLGAMGKTLQGTIRGTCEYMLVLLVVLECNSVYRCAWGRPGSAYCLEAAALLCGAVLLAALLWGDRHGLACLFASCPLLCAVMLFTVPFLPLNVMKTGAAWAVPNYMLVFLMFLPLMLAIFKAYHAIGEPYRLFHVLSDTMFVLASLSIVIWLLAVVAGKLQPTGEMAVDWAGAKHARNYFNLCFYWQTEPLPFSGAVVMRNTGIFPESPMYNIFLNTALYTELFLRGRAGWLRCALFSIAIGTTVGTLGVLLCAGGWAIKLFSALGSKRAKAIGYAALALSAAFGGALVLQKWQVGNSSFATHLDDYLASLKAWAAHPVVGCGYENEPFIQAYMGAFRADNLGLSNSIAVVLAEGGLVLSAFYLAPFLLLAMNGARAAGKGTAWWALGVFGIYATTIFHYRFFMAVVLAFGYSYAHVSYSEADGFRFRCTGTAGSPPADGSGGDGSGGDGSRGAASKPTATAGSQQAASSGGTACQPTATAGSQPAYGSRGAASKPMATAGSQPAASSGGQPASRQPGGPSPQPGKGSGLPLYLLTAALGICIIITAFNEAAMALVAGLFARYRLGLGDSQWRAIFLAMLLALCANAAKSIMGNSKGG